MERRAFKINHVGMAVPSIEAFLRSQDILYGGFERGELIRNTTQRVNEMFLTDGKTVVELLEPLGASSPLNTFLSKNRKGGLVHLAVDVDDLSEVLRRVEAAGGTVVVAPTPDVAFGERRIAFVALDGLLTELIER